MGPFQIRSISRPRFSFGELAHVRSRLRSPQGQVPKSAHGKWRPRCQLNFRALPLRYKGSQLTHRSYQAEGLFEKHQLPRAMAMESMEITDEQIHQEKRRVDEEELFLGKEELPDVFVNSDESGGPPLGTVASEMRECWDLWQRVGLPVERVAERQHMTETGVFCCIFHCIQNNYTVDWYELCKEAKFSLDIAKRMTEAMMKFKARAPSRPLDMRTVKDVLPSDTSDIHLMLFVTMLSRGLPFETIKEISFQDRDSKPEMEWGEEYADEERFPREATESGLLQWFKEKDGVSMIEIALKFRECNDLHLMRLLLKLEQEGKIFWREGIFRAI